MVNKGTKQRDSVIKYKNIIVMYNYNKVKTDHITLQAFDLLHDPEPCLCTAANTCGASLLLSTCSSNNDDESTAHKLYKAKARQRLLFMGVASTSFSMRRRW